VAQTDEQIMEPRRERRIFSDPGFVGEGYVYKALV
jgi:hypothetical protein